MKPVIVTGFIGATNLLLERDFHCFCLSNFKGSHALSLGDPAHGGKLNMLHYL
jgi:hypothetical protein